MTRVYAYKSPRQMNNTEKQYAQHLEMLRLAGEIESYSYEPETLRIGNDCRYTPDFRVLRNDPHISITASSEVQVPFYTIEFHEVKGTARKGPKSKPFVEDDALVKIKSAAENHPYKFIIVWKNGTVWEKREIN